MSRESQKIKLAMELVRDELNNLRAAMLLLERAVSGMQIALGEFHHDVEGKTERQGQEVQRLRERVSKLEGSRA